MKDQNTPTNTLESLYEVFNREFDCTYSGWALQVLDGDFQDINKAVEDLVSQAVNKVNEEAEYWRKRAARWKKEVEELNGKLMDIELNKDETPKGDK